MIAISSFKPFSKSPEIARNQLRAKASWNSVFSQVIYFGETEPRLASPNTQFIPYDGFPPISLMVFAASQAGGYACLINADIVVAPDLRHVWPAPHMTACTSRRWEFIPPNLEPAKVKDLGVDFFMAEPDVWRACWKVIPKAFLISHCGWDSWMLSFFNKHCGRRFCDITDQKIIFHPVHGERDRPHHIENPPPYSDLCGFPRRATNRFR